MSIKYTLDCLDPHLNKSLADHGILADVAEEALVVPSLSLKMLIQVMIYAKHAIYGVHICYLCYMPGSQKQQTWCCPTLPCLGREEGDWNGLHFKISSAIESREPTLEVMNIYSY